nr:hypothetical protein [Accumulibacter sp.]
MIPDVSASKDYTISPFFLGQVQPPICYPYQLLGTDFSIPRELARRYQADGDGDRNPLPIKDKLAAGYRLPQSLGKLDAVVQAADGESVKLFATISTDLILMPLGGSHYLGEADQDLVPGLMAMHVVHCLEMIDVQQQKDKIGHVAAAEITDIHLENPLEDGPFRQFGQFVEIADFQPQSRR